MRATGSNSLTIYFQHSNGSLGAPLSLPGIGKVVDVVDLDGNGLDDVVAHSGIAFQVAPRNFASVPLSLGSSQRRDTIAVDVDGDGDVEVVSANPTVIVWRGR